MRCPDPECGAVLALTVCGYRPNPTGDAPANRSPLSDPLPVAQRPEPGHRPTPTQQAPDQGRQRLFADFFNGETQPPRLTQRNNPPPRPARKPSRQAKPGRRTERRDNIRRIDGRLPMQEWQPARPCPPDAERLCVSDWALAGALPDGVSGAAIAAAYRRTFGTEPPREQPRYQIRAYSLRELGLALGDLGLTVKQGPAQGQGGQP